MKTFKITQIKRSRWNLELYHFYPEAGPVGTPGRGPYCIGWFPLKKSEIPALLIQLTNMNIQPLGD